VNTDPVGTIYVEPYGDVWRFVNDTPEASDAYALLSDVGSPVLAKRLPRDAVRVWVPGTTVLWSQTHPEEEFYREIPGREGWEHHVIIRNDERPTRWRHRYTTETHTATEWRDGRRPR
jgi:2-polyprenyl-6-methoxyphenol hydroxylase-like FAD-dependent oxidoreductase